MLHASELAAVVLFCAGVAGIYATEAWLLWRLLRRRPVARGVFRRRGARATVHGLALAGTACIAWGWLHEADALALTRPTLHVAGWPAAPLRVLHLTDTHLEGPARRVDRLMALVPQATADLVCYTGDYLNDRGSLALLESIGRAFPGQSGAFAVTGNWDLAGPDSRGAEALTRAGVRVLRNERVVADTPAGRVHVVGVDYPAQAGWQRLVSEAPRGEPLVFLYHSPDLVEDLAALGRPALYLCGHTHGGQVRLPLYGALITLAYHGKKYEMGAYAVGPVTLYVNRGVGMEAGLAPRVRFCCPPEVALLEVQGDDRH